MCKNSPVVREHHSAYRQRSAILHASLAKGPIDSGVGHPRLRDDVFLAASEQALGGSDQAREAFQTTQRTFLSVELQGKLYATVARYSQDRAPRK